MKHQFAICIDNTDYEASLELRKLYEVIPDGIADELGQIRVIDESGEDYLFPVSLFIPMDLPKAVEKKISHAA